MKSEWFAVATYLSAYLIHHRRIYWMDGRHQVEGKGIVGIGGDLASCCWLIPLVFVMFVRLRGMARALRLRTSSTKDFRAMPTTTQP
ncbi:uncharacterized protein K452DRAFT_67473 [Aplosporella prunicola CBS 121167]|uniref:Uncharacterized protein n=1 Tax=Aplosporella prunicola CBS 121167 TaxID=1176127 RepID=A0A6A6BV55_9PEZI|nr:uncharacterized protein K452DRAFT_67473 [Aplosporella prunicola CBS 121167]KAF2146561.1 hypothetical protein K452DRAFT_67473 [Aplosporella prunicola CBS 121167]